MFQICQNDRYGLAPPAVPWLSAGIGVDSAVRHATHADVYSPSVQGRCRILLIAPV
jgi:hypothetical protein